MTPRGALLEALAAALPGLVEALDHEAARIVHAAIGELLHSAGNPGAEVIDLAASRKRK